MRRKEIPGNLLGVDASHVAQIFTDLVRAGTRLHPAVSARLRAEQRLRPGQFELFETIVRVPGYRALDIVGQLAITVGAVSEAVGRLVATGWGACASRTPGPPLVRRSDRLSTWASSL
jgi:DNA-binding MarR family transcriptional regulator